MTIPKISSQDLNEMLANAKNNINNVNNKINTIKEDINTKMKILSYEANYINSKMVNLQNGSYIRSNNLKTFNKYCEGVYNQYGATITPDFIKKPVNIFNLQTSSSGEVFFRDDALVKINGTINNYNNDILKHDSINNKKINFYEFDTNMITVEITMDANQQLGPSKFNMIEIDPFLPGSFDIESVSIFHKEQNGTLSVTPVTYSNMKAAGKERIVLKNKYDFYKIIFKIKLNYVVNRNNINIYPFGLKHLYFYDADFNNKSYIVTTIDRQEYISMIRDEIYMMTSTGEYISTLDKEQIEVYSTCHDGSFEDRIYPSTNIERNEIAKNINTLYIKIPLKPNRSIIGVAFYVETKKQDFFFNNTQTVYIDRILKDNKLEGPYYSSQLPIDYSAAPSIITTTDTKKDKEDTPAPVYNTLSGFGKDNNLFEHKINSGFVFKTDIELNDITINNNNIYMIKRINSEKIPLIFDNKKDIKELIIKPVQSLDYDSQYTLYFKELSLVNGTVLPNYKVDFTTEDYDIESLPTQYYIPIQNYKIPIKFDFEPDAEYLNDKFIYIIDKNSNKILTNAEYINGHLIISAKAKLQEKQTYFIYIKKGIRNTKNKNILVKTIKQNFVTGDNGYNTLPDKIYVPLNSKIETVLDKEVCNLNNCIFLLNNNNNKINCEVNFNIDKKLLTISPKERLKSNSQYTLVVDKETPTKNGFNLGTTIIQKIFTRNEENKIDENILEYGRFSIPSNYTFEYKFDSTLKEESVSSKNITILNQYYNTIESNIRLKDNNTLAINLKNLNKDSRYYIVLNNIYNLSNQLCFEGSKIFTLETENTGTYELENLYLIPNDKILTVNIGNTIGNECLNNDYVYVINSKNIKVPNIINQPMNGCLNIKPPDNKYNFDAAYTVIIDKNIKDNQGITLFKPMKQCIKIIDKDIEYVTMKEVPNNYEFNIEMPNRISDRYLNNEFIYVVDSDYHKLSNINISYGTKDNMTLSNVIKISPKVGTSYPIDNLKLVISKDIKTVNNDKLKTKIIMFKTIKP